MFTKYLHLTSLKPCLKVRSKKMYCTKLNESGLCCFPLQVNMLRTSALDQIASHAKQSFPHV